METVMGRKNKSENRKKESKTREKNPRRWLSVFGAILVLAAGYIGLRSAGVISSAPVISEADRAEYAVRVKKAGLKETRPLMNPNRFKGRTKQIYQWASEIPEVFDALYCYCRCKENPRFRHKTLLTCYTDKHASKCGICLKEGEMAWEMTQKGISPTEIRAEVDRWAAANGL